MLGHYSEITVQHTAWQPDIKSSTVMGILYYYSNLIVHHHANYAFQDMAVNMRMLLWKCTVPVYSKNPLSRPHVGLLKSDLIREVVLISNSTSSC